MAVFTWALPLLQQKLTKNHARDFQRLADKDSVKAVLNGNDTEAASAEIYIDLSLTSNLIF